MENGSLQGTKGTPITRRCQDFQGQEIHLVRPAHPASAGRDSCIGDLPAQRSRGPQTCKYLAASGKSSTGNCGGETNKSRPVPRPSPASRRAAHTRPRGRPRHSGRRGEGTVAGYAPAELLLSFKSLRTNHFPGGLGIQFTGCVYLLKPLFSVFLVLHPGFCSDMDGI